MRAGILLAGAALIAAPACAARIVDYPIDAATLAKNAAEQGLAASPTPAKGTRQIVAQLGPGLDHRVIRVGIFCSAWTVDNPMSSLIRDMLMAHDPDGRLDDPGPTATPVVLTLTNAATLSRCVSTGDLASVCITKVSIDGTLSAGGDAKPRPLHVEIEQNTKGVGACAGLTRGIGLVSREAVIKLIAAADNATN